MERFREKKVSCKKVTAVGANWGGSEELRATWFRVKTLTD